MTAKLISCLALVVSVACMPADTTASPTQPQTQEQATVTRETAKATEPAVTLQRHTVRADDGHALALWEKSPPVPRGSIVLVHGRTWSSLPDFDLQVPGKDRSLMDKLAAAGYATYALDLRGYGETARDASQWLTPERAAADLASALAWVAQRRAPHLPAVFGWSMGSLVAHLCAQSHPERISALILYGYPRAPGARFSAGPPASAKPPRRATTAKAAAEDFINPKVIDDATIEAFVAAALAADPVRADWRASDQFEALDPAKVRVPTLVLHGELDPYAPVVNQAKLFARLGHPDRAWVIVAAGDHAAHLEDTGARFVHAVVSFLARPTLGLNALRG